MMPGAVLENLSGRKLSVLITILLICQAICFLIGGFIAPAPSHAERILATKCLDSGNNSQKWFFSRGKGSCENTENDQYGDHNLQANNIVFVFQLPLPKDNLTHDYSRWQQNLIGVLEPEIYYDRKMPMEERITITLNVKLGYRNKGEPDGAWKPLTSALDEKRILECSIDVKRDGYHYNCSDIPLLELGSLHHDFYLLNIRFPVDNEKKINQGLGQITWLWLVAIHQNGGFTKVWVSLKTIFFPIIIFIVAWFWQRVHKLPRPPALLEYMLLILGGTLTILNIPLEYLTLFVDMPFMILLSDIRQGIFYAALLSFWLVFVGEHLMIQDSAGQRSLNIYWKHLSAVAIGCLSLLIFDICERGTQLVNPFYSIWVTELGTNVALSFIILAGVSAGIYFFFLAYRIWEVFCNISAKRGVLPNMSNARRHHYQGVIYRFKFLMLATLLCAAMTIVGFILGQVSEGRWKWDEEHELELTSAFFTGVYGMWNIYIFALIVLYAPSHKQWPPEVDMHGTSAEEIEFSRLPTDPSEISSFTSFARKSALD